MSLQKLDLCSYISCDLLELTTQKVLDLHRISSQFGIKKLKLLRKVVPKNELNGKIFVSGADLTKELFEMNIDRITNVSQNLANGSFVLHQNLEFDRKMIKPFKVSIDVQACDQEIKRLKYQKILSTMSLNQVTPRTLFITNPISTNEINTQRDKLSQMEIEQATNNSIIQSKISRLKYQNQSSVSSQPKSKVLFVATNNSLKYDSNQKLNHYLRVLTKEATPVTNNERLLPQFNPVSKRQDQIRRTYLVYDCCEYPQQDYGPYKEIVKQALEVLPKIMPFENRNNASNYYWLNGRGK